MADILACNKSALASSLRYLLDAVSVACKHRFHQKAVEALMKIAQIQVSLQIFSPFFCFYNAFQL